MATYAIGDVQGCYQELMQLLEKIQFNERQDCLWFVGDLVNRGPNSLEVLRFIKDLPNCKAVLGNHDLHLLAAAHGVREFKPQDTLQAILQADDKAELIDWLRQLPLLVHDNVLDYVMVHAGLAPQWSLAQAQQLAAEVEAYLRSDDYVDALHHMYGNEPKVWHDDLRGWERFRCIINYFTRIRYCKPDGELDLVIKGTLADQPSGYLPWYGVPTRQSQSMRIVFGHWAALQGAVTENNVFALDTGCVWGGKLRAMRLEDQQLIEVESMT